MLTTGWFANSYRSDGKKRPNSCAGAHEHTVSRPDFDQYAVTYPFSNEHAYRHSYVSDYQYDYSDSAAFGYSFTYTNSHTDTDNLSHTVADSNQHPDSRAHCHTDSHKFAVADSGTDRYKCPNGNIHTRDTRGIVADTRPHCHTYANPDTLAHGCSDRHSHTDAHRDCYPESDCRGNLRSGNRVYLLRRRSFEAGAGRVRGNRQCE